MCGIAGIIGNFDTLERQTALDKMLKITRHRGPDNTGVFIDENIAIGMNRLAIIDLTTEANQPFYSKDKRYVMVYNGEIYNFQKLKSDLINKGVTFRTHSDTEVLLEMYIMYKEKMLNQIRGMFSFVIWDCVERNLFGARDHLGIKPFLYTFSKNCLVFCSELKGLIASHFIDKIELDSNGISEYFKLGHQIAPDTIIKGVKALRNGYYFEYSNQKFSETKYWFPELISPLSEKEISYTEVTQKVRSLVIDSVTEELISDVPLGVFLGGGIDSAIIVAAMRESGAKHINTYNIGFDVKDLKIDESEDAQLIASYYKTNHHAIKVDNIIINEIFDDFITGLDRPSVDGLNTYLVSKYTKKGVTVALSGLGADELFCGYTGFKQFLARKQGFNQKIISFLLEFNSIKKLLPERIYKEYFLKGGNSDDILFYMFLMEKESDAFTNSILSSDFKNINHTKRVKEFIFNNHEFSNTSVNKIRQLYISQFMTNMLLRDSDVLAMQHSLEVRFPYIDWRLVEFSYQIPQSYLIMNVESNAYSRSYLKDQLKRVLIDSFRDQLPEEILNRTKRGFQVPLDYWMRNALLDRIEKFVQNPSHLFNPIMVNKTFNLWINRRINYKKIWGLFILDSWYKNISKL